MSSRVRPCTFAAIAILVMFTFMSFLSGCGSSPSVGSIAIGFTSSTVAVGGTLQLHATDSTNLHVTTDATTTATWSSSNPAILSVNSSGLVTGITTGYATVRATLGQDTGAAVITVTGNTVTGLVLTPSNATVYLGGGQQYTATTTSSNGTSTDVTANTTWSVAPASVATITSAGLLKAVSSGNFTVTGVSGGLTSTTSGTVAAVALASIAVTPATVTIAGGNTQQFTAVGTYNDGSSRDLTALVAWSTNNTSLLTIDTKGLATAAANNTTTSTVTVTALQASVSGTASVQVTPGASITTLIVTPTSSSIATNSAEQHTATAWYSDGTQQDVTSSVTWSSTTTAVAAKPAALQNDSSPNAGSDSTVVSIDPRGITTAGAPGQGTVLASLGGMQASSVVIVTPAKIVSADITASHPLFPIGSTQPIAFTGTFSDGTTQDLTLSANWQSSNPAVATIDSTGVARGITAGPVTFTANFQGIQATSKGFEVTPASLVSTTLSPQAPADLTGLSQSLQVIGTYSDGSTQDLTALSTFTSADPTIFAVDSNGTAYGVSQGVTQITATVGGLSAIDTFASFTDPLVSIQLVSAANKLAVGTHFPFQAIATSKNGFVLDTSLASVWRSADPTILTVDGSGTIKAGKVGKTTISATALGVTGVSQTIEVTNATPTKLLILTNLDVPLTTMTVAAGTGYPFKSVAFFSDNTSQVLTQDVLWTSGDTTIATVDSTGLARGIKPGTTTITASLMGQTASVTFNVSNASLVSTSITPGNVELPVGIERQFTLTGAFSDGTTQDLTYDAIFQAPTPTIAAVVPHGLVLGVSSGIGKIIAQRGYFSASTPVNVTNVGLSGITMTPASASIRIGGAQQFVATGTFTNGYTQDLVGNVIWSSSAIDVARATQRGTAVGYTVGTAQISAAYRGITASTTNFQVFSNVLAGLTLTPSNPTVTSGSTLQLTATGVYADASTDNLTGIVNWTSSDTTLATVNSFGLLTAVAGISSPVTITVVATAPATTVYPTITSSFVVTIKPAGDGDGGMIGNPTAIQVTPTSAHIAAGTTKQLTATAAYADGTTKDVTSLVTWTTANPATATVNATGLVTSVRTGTVSIQAATGSLASSSIVVVSSATLASLAISPSGVSFGAGTTQQFVLTGTFSDGTTQDLSSMATWTTSNPAVATISSTGLATGVGTGSVQFTAAYGGMTVTSAPSNVTSSVLVSIALNPSTLNLAKGTTQQFTVIGTYSDGTTRNLTSSATYTTSNNAVISVTTAGLATAVGTGNAQITVTVGGQTASTQSLSVSPAVVSNINITPEDLTFAKGTTQQFTATGTFTDGTAQDLTRQVVWTSGSPQVMTIDQNGLATAGAQGNAQITAAYMGITATTDTLHVTPATVLNIILSPTTVQIAKGTTQQFIATGVFSDGTTQNITTTVTWSTSNGLVVSIDTNGVATANGPGSAQISATYMGKTVSTTSFTVTPATLVSVTFNPANPTVATGTSTHVSVIGTYSDGTTQDLTSTALFSSSNTAVASVGTGGVITGLAPGSATITVNAGGQTSSFPVTVSAAVLTSLVITPANPPAFAKGTTFQFTATGTFSDGTTQNLSSSVVWISSNTNVFTIDQNGLATGVGVGSASLTATFEGQTATTPSFQVTPATLASIAITPQSLSLAAGGTQQYTATATYTDNTTANITSSVTWSSSSTAVATINASGSVTAIAAGSSTIAAQLSGKTGSATLTVTGGSTLPTLQSIAITPAASSVAKGNTQQFTATGTYSDGSQVDITNQVGWQSSVSAVATISNVGLATSIAGGNTQIRAALAGQTAIATLTVSPATLSSLAVTPQTASVASGTTQQYKATGTLSDGSTQDLTNSVTWSSSSTSLATINASGLATTSGTGTDTITATAGVTTNSATLTITTATVTGLQVTPSPLSLPAGGTQQLLVTATFSDGSSQNVTSAATYTTSNSSVVTVDASGKLHAIGPGNATVTITLNGTTTTLTVTIGNATVTSVAITPQNPTIAAGQSQQLTATATYSDGSTQDLTSTVTWTTSNSNVATVSPSGNVIVAQAGSATITATYSGVSASDSITGTAAVATAISVSPAGINLAAGQTQQFNATATMSDGTQQSVTTSVHWSVSDPTKASVSNSTGSAGLFTANAAGSVNVVAALNGISGSATVTISVATLSSLTINPSAIISLPAGTNEQLSVTGAYSDGSSANVTSQVTWSSSQASTAYVDSSALLHAVSSGITTINAVLQGVTGTSAVTVSNATLTSITITPAAPVLALGQTVQLTATGTYSDGSTANITSQVRWNSGTPAVATVSSTGLVTTLTTGTSTLSATLNGVSGSTPLTVTSATLQSISVQSTASSFALGTSLQLKAVGRYSDGSTQDLTNSVTWSSSTPAVGVVSSAGIATGVTTGTFNARATSNGVTGSLPLTVSNATLVSIAVTPNGQVIVDIQGTTVQFTATGTFTDGSTQNLTNTAHWSTSGIVVGSISQTGIFSPTGVGVGTVVATSGSISGSAQLTVVSVPLI